MAVIANCSKLNSLSITGFEDVTETPINKFLDMSRLTELELKHGLNSNGLNEDGFIRIVEMAGNIKSLSLAHNIEAVTDRVLETVANFCKNLEKLDIAYTHVTT